MSDLHLRALAPDESSDWPEALTGPATFTALDSWLNLAHSLYGFPIYRFETRRRAGVTGLLALAHVRHPIFGTYLVTAPFGSYGGFAWSDKESRDLLLRQAQRLTGELKVDYVNIRFDADKQNPPDGWVQNPIYCTYLLDLSLQSDSLFANFSSNHRKIVRRSLKKVFNIKFNHFRFLDDVYEVLASSMREIGSPYHSKSYLKTMAELFGDRLEFAVLHNSHGQLAGAAVFIIHGKVVACLHAHILRAFRSECAGEFLYWKSIENYCEQGFKVLDLGRSLIGSGNESFKMKWNPRRRPLAYWYALQPGAKLPALHQHNPKFAPAIWTWKRLPSAITRTFGPFLIRGLA